MTTIINASPSNGLVQTADGSGVLKVQSNGVTTNALAWVQFAGASGTRNANYNVSSVTRNSTGNYTVAYTSALTDANYVPVITTSNNAGSGALFGNTVGSSNSTASFTFATQVSTSAAAQDPYLVYVAVFGN